MSLDHFKKTDAYPGKVDWNFNVLFRDQPQVAEMTSKYAPILKRPELYSAVPGKWLHATVLRVGLAEEFEEQEMIDVAADLEPKLAALKFPKLMLGQWWLWNGNPCLHITPDGPFHEMFQLLVYSLKKILGEAHLPKELLFKMPHITLAYSKSYDDELSLYKELQGHPVNGVEFRAHHLSLIKQRVEDNFYKYQIIKDLPIGQGK